MNRNIPPNRLADVTEKDGYAIASNVTSVEMFLAQMRTFSAAFPHLTQTSDVRPVQGGRPASSQGKGYFDLHTDLSFLPHPAKYVGLLCKAMDPEGGESLLADARQIISRLSKTDNDALSTEKIEFRTPIKSTIEPIHEPIIDRHFRSNDDFMVRYHSSLDIPQLCARERLHTAISNFRTLAREAMMIFRLDPGEALYFDNHRMLHGRTAITADPSVRHLVRSWGMEKWLAEEPSSQQRAL